MLQRNIKEALQPRNLNNHIVNIHSPLRTNNNSDENTVDTTQGTDNIDTSGLTLLNQAFTNNLTNRVNNNTHDTNRLLMPSTTNKSSPTLQIAINNNNKKAKDTYKSKNPQLYPLKEVLASQLQPIRNSIELIALKNLQDTKEVYQKTKVLDLWTTTNDANNNNNDTPTDSTQEENIVLPENTFVPKSINLKGVHLGITKTLRENDDCREKLLTITNRFEKLKNKFLLEGSQCAKEVAELKLQLALRNRSYNIAKGFHTLTHFTVLYHIKLNKNESFSTKPTDVIAGCILIKFLQYIQKPFFDWLKIDRTTLITQITSILGDNIESSAAIINNPICGRNETKLYTCIKQMLLTPIFENVTFKLAEWHKSKNEENYRKKQMYSIIKTNRIEKITEATKNGLDNLELDEKGEKLISHITTIVSKMESNLNRKITNTISKNFLGADKKHPVSKAIEDGPKNTTVKASKKRQTAYIHKNKYKIERAKNPQKNKQQKTVTFIQTKQKRTRENQEGMKREPKRGRNKRKQIP